jgi:hypothetical protein
MSKVPKGAALVKFPAVLLIVCTVALVAVSHERLPTRHTLSSGSSLVALDPESSVWVKVAGTREIWVAPDGSGRIEEQQEPLSFPSETEQGEWVALGSPVVTPMSQAFGPGGLVYLRLDDIPRDPTALADQLVTDGASPPQILRRVVLLLYETVPPVDLTSALVSALRLIPSIVVEDLGTMVRVSGMDEASEGRVLTTIVIDLRSGQLVTEERVARAALPGLTADPPIVILERTIDLSEQING